MTFRNINYFKICASEIRTHKIIEISPKTREDIIFLTESGYLMVVKSFTDDLAWTVQRQLVNAYFRSKKLRQYNIEQSEIIMTVKKLYENNYELNEKIERLNYELNKNNRNFTVIIQILCEKVLKFKEKGHSGKLKK